MPKAINDADFDTEVVKSNLPVLIDFWAPWCGPCKAMNPILEELDEEMKDKVKFVKMNVDENTDIPGKFGVMSIPTFVIFKNGEPIQQFVGAKSKESMKKEIEAAIG